jgi:cytochrome P450
MSRAAVPGPRGLPVVGVLPAVMADPLAFLEDAARRHGDVVHLPVMGQHVYLVTDLDAVQQIFTDTGRAFSKGLFFERQKPTFGEGLLTSDGELWRRQRRLVQPAFHMKRIAGLTDAMASIVADGLDRWERHAASGEPLELTAEMMALTQRIILRTMFDTDAEAERAVIEAMPVVLDDLTRRAMGALVPPRWVPTPGNVEVRRALATIDRVVYRMIEEHRGPKRGANDLLTMLLEATDEEHGRMSDRQLRDEAVTIYVAGHETTANSLAWAGYLLAAYPREQRRVEAEVDAVLGSRRPRFEDVAELAVVRRVMTETMRLYPANWAIARTCEEDVTVGGHRLAKGSHVLVSSYLAGRDPRHWEDPARFDPDRFLPERSVGRHRLASFPFGAGPRQCIGTHFAQLEQALVVAMIAQRYRLELVPRQRIEPEPLVTIRPRPGVWVHVRRRARTGEPA